jgi:predicted dehydrogenase
MSSTAKEPAAQKKVRFGLIGLGRHGARYARHLLNDVPGARLTAVCRRDEAAGKVFAEEHGLSFYADYGRMMEDPQVDAVAVVVSPDLHLDICRAAVEAGKHIVLEKPLARSLSEGHQIRELISSAAITFMLAQTMRFNSVVQEMRRFKDQLGAIHLMAFNQRTEPFSFGWRDDARLCCGTILDIGVHMFDLAHFFSGAEPAWAWCRQDRIVHHQTQDLFAAVLGFRDPRIVCTFDSCKYTGGRSGRIELVGERGQLVGDHIWGTLSLIQDEELIPLDVPGPVHTIIKVLETFVDCIRTDRQPPITVQDGLRTLRAVELCNRSAAGGRIVDIDEIHEE